ncbi:MAG: Crp/Fnr family transcriptional regulator [Thermoanaerobacteraceae bacterium]|nr:Crp/Fnr family transcriptional regulator [Thermoanaerobacteraceae bacterium]
MVETAIIKKVPIFSMLDEDTLRQIATIVTERPYKKNMIIFFEGEPGEAVYFVVKGKVKIFKTNADGKEQIIHIMEDGDVFAESVIFTGLNYPASAEVLEDSVIGMLRCYDLENLIKQNGSLAVAIINFMGRRLQFVSGQIKNLGLRDAMGRVVDVIIKMAERGRETPNGIMIDFRLPRQEFASMAGTTRETATRALSALQREGSVFLDRDILYIKDMKKLKRWLD